MKGYDEESLGPVELMKMKETQTVIVRRKKVQAARDVDSRIVEQHKRDQ